MVPHSMNRITHLVVMNGLPTFDRFTRSVMAAVLGALAAVGAAAAPRQAEPAFLVRDRSLELPTRYVPPPGNPLEHHAAGFAQIMCSAVFITGLDADFAAENVGYFTAPYAARAKLGKPVIDRNGKTVSVAVPGGPLQASIIRRRCRARPFEPYPGCCSTADRTQTAALSMCGARPGWMVICRCPATGRGGYPQLAVGHQPSVGSPGH